jgi:hypothetical protein
MAVIQDASLSLAPGATAHCGFFGILEEHHPAATGSEDLALVGKAVALPEAAPAQPRDGVPTDVARAHSRRRDAVQSMSVARGSRSERWRPRQHVRSAAARRRAARRATLSFFTGANRHVVMRAKELVVLRPHGQIMRTGDRLCATRRR